MRGEVGRLTRENDLGRENSKSNNTTKQYNSKKSDATLEHTGLALNFLAKGTIMEF